MQPLYEPIDLDDLIDQANSLEPLPASATRLAEILSQPDWELEDVVDVVSFDPGLTGKLLGLANGVTKAAQDRVSTVDQAVLRLGAGSVLAVAISSGVKPHLNVALPEYGLSEGELWSRSVAAATVADELRNFTERRLPMELSTAALLHDIGKLILGRNLDEALLHYLDSARESEGLSEERAEIEVLGVNHAELGGLVAQNWNLPQVIVDGVSYHHAPQDFAAVDHDALIAHATLLCSRISDYIVAGEGRELPAMDALLASSKIRLGLSNDAFEALCEEARDRFEEVRAIYG